MVILDETIVVVPVAVALVEALLRAKATFVLKSFCIYWPGIVRIGRPHDRFLCSVLATSCPLTADSLAAILLINTVHHWATEAEASKNNNQQYHNINRVVSVIRWKQIDFHTCHILKTGVLFFEQRNKFVTSITSERSR